MGAQQHLERIDEWIEDLEAERKQDKRIKTLERSMGRLMDALDKRQGEYWRLTRRTYWPFR